MKTLKAVNLRLARRAMESAVLAVLLCPSSAVAADVDRALLNGLVAEDPERARVALEEGANPNAVLGSELEDHALCAAIDSRGTQLLELLIDFDVDLDIVADEHWRVFRSPVACAIHYYNPEAFELLLELGADPDPDLCPECLPQFGHTPLTEALAMSRFPMALRLVESTTVDDIEMRYLYMALERRPYDVAHPWNPYRDALIEWVRNQGLPIDPKPAGVSRLGPEPRCVFSVRDMAEGRREPSICP